MNRPYAAACAAWIVVCWSANVGVARAQAVPDPWSGRDIGAPALAGSSSLASGVFRIDAGGQGIGGELDQFHFVYQAVTGDVDIRARVDSITRASDWSKAGVMIRASLVQRAAHGSVLVSAGRGTVFQRRRAQSGTTVTTERSNLGPPRWVRLRRVGSTVTSYSSTDGTTWAAIASDTVSFGSTVYVGIAVSSHNTGARTTASVSNVALNSSAPPPVNTLPAGQASKDVGQPAIAGSVAYSSGQYTIRGAGDDIWDTTDQFHYVYQAATGDIDVVARVRSISPANAWSKAGVMIRESLTAGSPHAMALASAANGYAFRRRAETGVWSENTNGGSGTPPGWVRLVRKGDVMTAFRSPDGIKWTSMGSDTIPMNETVYVGIAVNSRTVSAATTAVVDSLKITATTPAPSNRPPAVVLSAPVNGAVYTAPAAITLTASASDADGSVAMVEFYANGALIGRDTAAPYSVGGSLGQGTYSITAVATDEDGASTTSSAVSITVKAPTEPSTGLPRLVSFTASADHATLVVRYKLEIYGAGATPGVSKPIATSDLGKPAPTADGTIVVDRAGFFQALAPGNYMAAVVAVSSTASARSQSVTFTR